MAAATYDGKAWSRCEIKKTEDFLISPAAKALHYGLEIFEGLKAFRQEKRIVLFRPLDHIRRMARSAQALAMPAFPEKYFLDALIETVARNKDCVPREPNALYIRPMMLGTSPQLGVGPSAQCLFYIIATPSRHPAKLTAATAWVTPDHVRAVKGGLGGVKAAANYAASIQAIAAAKKLGFDQVLFLDANKRRYIEEFSGMNFLCVEKRTLKTPHSGKTVLPGITRDALLRFAADLKIPAVETAIDIDNLCAGIASSRVTELLACGTGASVMVISELGWKGRRYKIKAGAADSATSRLHRCLLETQFGRRPAADPAWIIPCA
jgi:branched-chain amino acid aminotransferase